MALLFEEDYRILEESGLAYEEDEKHRFLVLRRFPLIRGMYVAGGDSVDTVDVLYVIPPNYNVQGGDMFWVRPQLARTDGEPIPAIQGCGQDSRNFNGEEFCRWSRHWGKVKWRPKQDNIQTILNRIEWALRNPSANK